MPISVIRVGNPDQSGFVRLISAASNSGPQLVFNPSIITVFVTNSQRGNTATVDNAPLEPGGAISFDGSQDIYAFTNIPGATADISILPSALSRALGTIAINGNVNATVTGNVNVTNTPSVTVSGTPNVNISSGSVAITTPAPIDVSAANVNVLPQSIGPFTQLYGQGTTGGASAFTVATSATATPLNLVDVSKYASYDLSFAAFVATQGTINAALTNPIVLQWYDDNTSGIPVYQEEWWVWMAASLGGLGSAVPNVWGTGKMHGRYMTVSVSNFGNSLMTVQYMHVYGSPRDGGYSNWRQNGNAMTITSSGSTLQQSLGQGFDNRLGELNGFSVGVSSFIFVPLSLFSGPIFARSNANQAWANPLVLCHAAQLKSGGIVTGTGNQGILWNAGTATGDQVNSGLIAPRAPLFFAAAATGTPPSWTFLVTAKESQ